MKISELLEVARARTVPLVRGVRDGQLDTPTPCADYDVRGLLNHLFHVVVQFQALAAKKDSDFTTTPDYLTGDWRGRFDDEVASLVAAWAAPGADEGVTGAMAMPAGTVGAMVLLDLTVHGWDLARATGQEFVADERVVRALEQPVKELAPTARQMNMFAEPVAVPDNADPFAALLATTGRDPH